MYYTKAKIRKTNEIRKLTDKNLSHAPDIIKKGMHREGAKGNPQPYGKSTRALHSKCLQQLIYDGGEVSHLQLVFLLGDVINRIFR